MERSDGSNDNIIYRNGTSSDMRAVQTLFMNSLYDLLHRYSMSDHDKPTEEELQSNWEKRKDLYEFLTEHAEHYWLAERDGQILGYARTVCDDGLRELTELFVSPDAQSHGVGRELLQRAFPSDAETINCIIATEDVRAHARYLKAGVHPRFLIYVMYRAPQIQPLSPRLEAQPLGVDDESLALLATIDQAILGHRREPQHRWLLTNRSGYLYRVDGEVIGYGYVGQDSGPFALVDPAWFPFVLAHAEAESVRQGNEEIYLCIPTPNQVALQYCLELGYKIDEFLMHFFSSEAFGQFDRYISTDPSFVL